MSLSQWASISHVKGVQQLLSQLPEASIKDRPLVVSHDTSLSLPCLLRVLVNLGGFNLFILIIQPHLQNFRPPSYQFLNVGLYLSGLWERGHPRCMYFCI